MGMTPKIDYLQLDQLVRQGKRTGEIAKFFGVTSGAVSQAKHRLKNMVVKTMALEKGAQVVQEHLDVMAQLRKINRAINEELDRAKVRIDIAETEGKDTNRIQETVAKLSSEIRQQLLLQLQIVEMWFDAKRYAEFQSDVLEVLESMGPGAQNEAIRRLKQKQLLRGLVSID